MESTAFFEQQPQINLQNVRINTSVNTDSVQLNITRTQFNIINIDTIEVVPIIPKIREQIKTETIKPSLTKADSLKLNLTGQKKSFINWELSIDYDPESFNETLFSEIDYQLLASQKPESDSLFVFSDTQTTGFLRENSEIAKTYTETSDVKENTLFSENNLLKSNNPFLLLILAAIVITGFVRLNWKDYIRNIFRSFFFQVAEKKMSIINISYTYPSFILSFLFLFNCSLFLYEFFKLLNISFLNFDLLLIPIFFSALAILLSVKKFFFHLIGNVFDTSQQIKLYLKGSLLMCQAFAIMILPIICLVPFLSEIIQIYIIKFGAGIFIVMYIMQIGRGIKIILRETYSIYYIFLYLCALEFLPLFLIVKFISEHVN